MESIILIKNIEDKYVIQLVNILNNDSMLLYALGSKKNKISEGTFTEHNRKWCESRNAEIFAIVLDDIAIGTISLSHQDLDKHIAQIGYWIGSKYWRNGYTSEAFFQVLNIARKKGIKCVSATIKKDNLPSKKVWEKYGANIRLVDDRYNVSITL
ncbi:GNAT family N-acetyltransferase [Clostridium scatologenes]|uniref:N-acetyltransferase domain-containing protein n=1 Tax=Clostridium scatologenes TaxID=1548 RepID=A0A0E3K528_CLOSL|nr:GNAT family N-acetyltransferase [Clostridium scatologenes]AKA72193.1 hypothetical protein CSCA_5068 [Clostridium scatologenes]